MYSHVKIFNPHTEEESLIVHYQPLTLSYTNYHISEDGTKTFSLQKEINPQGGPTMEQTLSPLFDLPSVRLEYYDHDYVLLKDELVKINSYQLSDNGSGKKVVESANLNVIE